MDPTVSLVDDIMAPNRLEALMLRDYPVVPPDSIIKTSSRLKGSDVQLVMSQDKEGLASGSMVLRNGEWARFFLDTWIDPMYRSYNFLKAESHALVCCVVVVVAVIIIIDWLPANVKPDLQGTHGAMASNDIDENGAHTAANHQLVWQWRPGRSVSRRRLCGSLPRLYGDRCPAGEM